jgi:hypothetical protein
MVHGEEVCFGCGAEELSCSASIGTDCRHSGSGIRDGFCNGSGFASEHLIGKHTGCGRTMVCSCSVLVLSTEVFLFTSRRNRRISFHGVDIKLEIEGHRSEVRADTAYTSISSEKFVYEDLGGSRHTGSWLSAMLAASRTRLLQDKEGGRQATEWCHIRFMM